MNELQMRNLLNEFVVGQQEAIAAITVAIGASVDRDKLAEHLRVQFTTCSRYAAANPVRDALIEAAWKAVRPPML